MKDDCLFFYQNHDPTKKYDKNSSIKWASDWTASGFYDRKFKIGIFSSNNPKYLQLQGGYYFCRQRNIFMLVSSNFISGREVLGGLCGNKTLFIPTSKTELLQATNSAEQLLFNGNHSVLRDLRIYTDYKRTNKSYFWSETARDWWNFKNDSKVLVRNGCFTVTS